MEETRALLMKYLFSAAFAGFDMTMAIANVRQQQPHPAPIRGIRMKAMKVL